MSKLDLHWANISRPIYAESPEDSDKAYSELALTYDDDLVVLGSVGNKSMAEHSIDYIRNERDATILDVAAGTGLTAQAFRDAGYKGIFDAVDLNAEMLEVARKKGLYRELVKAMSQSLSPPVDLYSAFYRKIIRHKLSADEALPVENGSYDTATIAGALLTNHLPQGCVVPVIDTLKPGGLLIFNCRGTRQNAEYQAAVEKIVESMVQAKKLELVIKETVPYYKEAAKETGGPMMSMLYIYKKL